MIRTTLKIEGMMCGMCEAHINEAIRNHFPVLKVSSTHKKGLSIIDSEQVLDEAALTKAINAIGYELLEYKTETIEDKPKHSFFGRKD